MQQEEHRHCKYCNETRPISDFQLRKETGRLRPQCRKCRSKKTLECMKKDPQARREYWKKQYHSNPEYFAEKNRLYREKNKDVLNEKNRIRRRSREFLDSRAAYLRERRATLPWVRIRENLCRRINGIIHGKKHTPTAELIGCSPEFLLGHLDHKPGNEIDHIIPCSLFNLENKNEALVCFNWKNLRSVPVGLNRSKLDAIPIDWIDLLAEIEDDVFKDE